MSTMIVVVCAWCKRLKDSDRNQWTEHTEDELKPEIIRSHGICPDCEKEVWRENGL